MFTVKIVSFTHGSTQKAAALYIDTHQALVAFAERAAAASIIAVDTEFIREKTYYPKLCLIQAAARYQSAEGGEPDEEYVIIDPLAIDDLSPLTALMADEGIMKVFHSCDQDVAILCNELGCAPKPIFDTQRAAQLLGHVQQIGLGMLIKAYCDVKIDKSDSFTDWARRPLTDDQCEYAYNDVRYLPRIYEMMRGSLEDSGRVAWLEEEFARLSDPENYRVDTRKVYQKVKHSANLKPRQLCVLRELADWRERAAQQRDYPRKWVATDEILVEVAKRMPLSEDELYLIRGAREKLSRTWANGLLAAVQRALCVPSEEWPRPTRGATLNRASAAQIDLLSALVRQRAFENRIAHGILSSQDELRALAGGLREGLPVLEGWRRSIVGAELIELLDGTLALSLEDGDLKVTKLTQANS